MATASNELEDTPPDVSIELRASDKAENTSVFEEMCEERGLTTHAARARYMGVSPRQLKRIVEHDDDPSSRFIAVALARFPRCSFRSLFAVIDKTTGKERR